MKDKIANTIKRILILVDKIAEIIFDATLALFMIVAMGIIGILIIRCYKFNIILGTLVLIVSLAWLRVITK